MVKLKSMFRKTLDGPLQHPELLRTMELSKHFKVIKVLGRGSYSTVYEVERRSDGLRYALKATDVGSLNARERKDMVNEIRLLASLQHPNLLVCYEAFCDKQTLCIVTELATGGDLGTLIDKRAEAGDLLPERQVWSYFLQVALALQYLHHSHVLHRDIKPQNILISASGLLKVADLGIAQVLDTVFTRALIGTPYYMSPEMYRRDPYSYSADVWALGCILYELCALRPLFMAREERDIKRKVLSGMLEPLPPRYSIELWDVMRMMLTPDPAHRPTIDEVLQMPGVRSHLGLVPEEDKPVLATNQDDRVMLLQPIQVPRMSSDWERINAFLPPSKYVSGGKGVVEALRVKASVSCPDLNDPPSLEGALEGAGNGELVREGSGGGGGLFGPATGLRFQFGEVTVQPVTRRGRGQIDPDEGSSSAFRKVPSDNSLRGSLMRSHTVSVGQIFFEGQGHHRGGGGGSGGSREGSWHGGSGGVGGLLDSRGSAASEGTSTAAGGAAAGAPQALPQDSKDIARVVAEAWQRARSRGSGGNGVTGRRSVSVGQVLLNHIAADDYEAAHERHEQEWEALLDTFTRFSPAPLDLCPVTGSTRPAAPAPATGAAAGPRPAAKAAGAIAGAAATAPAVEASGGSAALAPGSDGGRSPVAFFPPSSSPKGAASAIAVPTATSPGGANGSPLRKGKSVSWGDEAPAPQAAPAAAAKGWGEEAPGVTKGKKRLFGFLRKLGSSKNLSET